MYSLYVQVNAGGFTARIIPSMEPADRSALRDLTGRPRVINLPIHDASSIEVVRGPNSALYGRTTIGGAVNVRTSEPTAGHEADFDLTGGGFGFVKGVARASGPAADWGGYFVSAASERNNGFYHVGVAGVFGRFSIEPTSRLILTAGGRYDRLDLENTLTFRDGMPVVEDVFDAFSPKLSATVKLLPDDARADWSRAESADPGAPRQLLLTTAFSFC